MEYRSSVFFLKLFNTETHLPLRRIAVRRAVLMKAEHDACRENYKLLDVAIISTKVPILLGHGFWSFSLPKLPRYEFLSMMHEARTDLAMWFSLLFLLTVGAGRKWSLDAKLAANRQESEMVR
jgi:hypothetical protein